MSNARIPFIVLSSLVLGGFALLFFGLYQKEVERDLLPSGTEVIGQIVITELDVARRPNARLLWSKLDSRATVYKRDTIRTGPGSKVVVKLNNNSSVALGENTLVVLETENESLSLKLADGDVEFSGDISVQLDGSTKLRSIDGTLRLKRDSASGKDKIAAVSGKAEVISGTQIAIVESGEVLVKGQEGAFKVSGETLQEAGLSDLGLKNDQNLLDTDLELQQKLSALNPKYKISGAEGSRVLKLSWNQPKEASKFLVKLGSKQYDVMGSTFDMSLQDYSTYINEKLSLQASGSGGTGVDQVIDVDQETKDLILALGSKPTLLTPFEKSRLLLNRKNVTLRWSDSEKVSKKFQHYLLQIKFEDGSWKDFKTENATYDFAIRQPGAYSWNVKAVFRGIGPGVESATSTFDVISGADLSAPVVMPSSELQ